MQVSNYPWYLAVLPAILPGQNQWTPERIGYIECKTLSLELAKKNPDSLMYYALCKYMRYSPQVSVN
jgi:hypothetical protein